MSTATPSRQSAFARRPVFVPGLGWMHWATAAREWSYWLKPLLMLPRLPGLAWRRIARLVNPAPYRTDANGVRWAADIFAK